MLKWTFLGAFLPAVLCAQMPLGGVCPGRQRPVHDLNLSEAQQKQIADVCKESSKKVFELRESWNKAEADLRTAFDESPVDQGKSNLAIEHLAAARHELFLATSQMELKIRMVLTDEQWQELKKRTRRGGPGGGRPGGPNGPWRRGGPATKSTAPTGQPQNP